MGKLLWFAFVVTILFSCGKKRNIPDVSNISVPLVLQRFDDDFFSADTNLLSASMDTLNGKYPGFVQDFVFNILGLPPQPDSAIAVEQGIKSFLVSYKPIRDSAVRIITDLEPVRKSVVKGLQFVKYYFPEYGIPTKLITFVGPLNSYGNIITADAFAVGLQLYMGKNFSLYQSEEGQQLYPLYISRRFETHYIPVNCIKNIVDDLYPDKSAGLPLVEQMIEAGKRLYLLDQLMPEVADTLKTGYTKLQLDGAYANEAFIWSFFIQNDLLYATDPAAISDYMNDGPKTAVLGEQSPGNIGQFVGWQIIKKWLENKESTHPKTIMQTDAKTIFNEARYKPV